MTARARLAAWLYAFAAGIYLIDRSTKVLVEETLRGRPAIELIPGVLHLDYTENAGGAFGLFGGQPWLFFAATVLVSAIVVVASARLTSLVSAVSLGLILGGAVGNLTDRIIRGPGVSGSVIDFIDLQVWPVFNVADSAIVVGAFVMVLAGLRDRDREIGR